MVRYLFYTIGDLTYQSPLVSNYSVKEGKAVSVQSSKEVSCPPEGASSLKKRLGLHGQMTLRATLA